VCERIPIVNQAILNFLYSVSSNTNSTEVQMFPVF